MNIYLVIKVAAYNHDIFGAFENKKDAISKAVMLSKTENDDYHSFDVIQIPLDGLRPIKTKDYYGQYCEQVTILSIKKLFSDPKEEENDFSLNLLEY